MHPVKLAAIAAPAAALVLAAAPVSATTAAPMKPACKASMSHPAPKDYTTDDVRITAAPGARITTAAYYKTTVTVHEATAGSNGKAVVAYRISDATPGYRVRVGVLAVSGMTAAACLASFTPHA